MGRPFQHGPAIVAADIQSLGRMLRRIESDRKRYPTDREALITHIKGAMTILLNADRSPDLLEAPEDKKRTA